MKHYAIYFTLLTLAICGCSKTAHPPAEFCQRLSTADHIVVTNRFRAFGTVISGAEVSSLGKAVATASKKLTGASTFCDWDVDFFAGTNHLAGIRLHDSTIMVEGVEYSDGTGVVEAFWEKLERDRER